MALKYADIPVVAAPFGLALGGGCEIPLHSTRVRLLPRRTWAWSRSGSGVVPAGGGTKEMALRAHDRGAGVPGVDPLPFLKRAFDPIAFARSSTSGAEAQRMFFTAADSISPNPDRLLADAKEIALGLARAGHRPGRPRTDVPVLGPARARHLQDGHPQRGCAAATSASTTRWWPRRSRRSSAGATARRGLASEQHFLDLEREAFLSLLGTKKTQERIQFMLKEGKPLRN